MEQGTARKIVITVMFLLVSPLLADNPESAFWQEPSPITVELSRGDAAVTPGRFILAALLYSGVAHGDIPRYQDQIHSLLDRLTEAYGDRPRDARLAEALLEELHRSVLTRYRETATELDLLIDDGLFNCVSSSILYAIVLDAFGFPFSAVRTSDHAFIKVLAGGTYYDVETTSRYGFDPGRKKEFRDEFGSMTGFVYTPPSNYSDRIDISRTEFLSLILQNRITIFMQHKQYEHALAPGIEFFTLRGDKESLEMLVGIVQRVGLSALERKQYAQGLLIMDRAVSTFRDFEQFEETRRQYILDWSRRLVDAGSYEEAASSARTALTAGKIPEEDYRRLLIFRFHREAEAVSRDTRRGPGAALDILARARRELGGEESLLEAEHVYARNFVLTTAEQGDVEKAFSLLNLFTSDGRLTQDSFRELYVFLTLKKAESSARRHDYLEAIQAIEEGLSLLGEEKKLHEGLAVYMHNYALRLIEEKRFSDAKTFLDGERCRTALDPADRGELIRYYYQSAADALFGAGKTDAALELLETGMRELPGDRALLKVYEVKIHNLLVDLVRGKEFDRAHDLVRRGLT
ncbi:MAG TPA: hypothetical protein ENN69_01265, partial [Spirochaetia bacterium]|nr:hypothetical protein [Spirochaetia bacterium]